MDDIFLFMDAHIEFLSAATAFTFAKSSYET